MYLFKVQWRDCNCSLDSLQEVEMVVSALQSRLNLGLGFTVAMLKGI